MHDLTDDIDGDYQLPLSLTQLRFFDQDECPTSAFVDNLLAKLPPNVRYLSLPYDIFLSDNTPFVMPDSLVDLEYETGYDNIAKLVLPTDRQYRNYNLTLGSVEQLQTLKDQTWIVNILLKGIPQALSGQFIPSHIRVLEIQFPSDQQIYPLEKGQLPDGLEELYMSSYNQPIKSNVLPTELRVLMLGGFNQDIKEGTLPPQLKSLFVSYDTKCLDQFNIGLLPNSLST
ncbi:hypothetical protein CYY_005678 [Polysphondylium violaceum]|uniref:Uncharacterized protein n=1 Tax=Polysphondylium violaceum TaxID=133409 RepID=A0A8J4PSH5_9MYCE|nr:hypothetical protein CYY_005678 [Polysphondylium violaceum]